MTVSPAFLDAFHALDAVPGKFAGSPPSKKLSMLLRPSFIAPQRKTLVWGDWSAIEARVLPWLAASPGAEAKLDIFRENDKDPTKPDIYIITAADLTGRDPEELWQSYLAGEKMGKDARQAEGKVPELSLGFGGALGALMAMATNYGVYLDQKRALEMIERWRFKNAWAKAFWGKHGREGSYGLWGAANSAIENPDTPYVAGRVAYVYDKSYLGGTLFCALPCGRLLTYPGIKWEWREIEDKKTKKLVDRYQLTFLKGYGRKAAWYGVLAENSTQATAASVLRRTLKRLEKGWHQNADRSWSRYNEFMPVVMHVHDDIVTETDERDENRARAALLETMERNDAWDEGLPLKADIASAWAYKQAKEG